MSATKSLAHPGIGFVYDGEHTIYYTDLAHVWTLNTLTGKSQILIENIHSHELAMDSLGVLYGEHYWYIESQEVFKNYIWKYEQNGRFEKIRLDQIGENDDYSFVRDEGFNSFRVFKKEDRFVVIRNENEVYYEGEMNNPTWSAITKDGNLIIVDYPQLLSVNDQVLDTLLNDLSISRMPFSMQHDHHHLYGVWFDRDKSIYVANYGGRSILKVTGKESFEEIYTSPFFWSPVNGLFDNAGNLWVLEASITGNIRVQKVRPSDLSTSNGNVGFWITGAILGCILIFFLKKQKRQLATPS